ncbi:c-type cytochrome [Corallococcus sp. CA047B]|uniref:c-type cytochrome n=1 Tax=Corallococcus sp. CA047B TaxID=2316729 RepID=UPI001F443A06|nr:cytochrome C [Corallococcus sp. CA047B]
MTLRMKLLVVPCAALSFAGGVALATSPVTKPAPPVSEPLPKHAVPASKDGNLVLGLCDGETSLEVEGVKEGQKLTREQALRASSKLMADWRQKNPDALWDEVPGPALAQATPPNAKKSPAPAPQPNPGAKPASSDVSQGGVGAESGAKAVPQQQKANLQTGHTYGAYSERDEQIWADSTQAFVKEGHRVFHDAEAVGGTVGVSCDMCHPDGANTHPETYPKYQVQLGRVALLRDMINWCIENPARGKPLADGDPRMRAMEAYIYAQRKGTKLEYGKH